MPPLTSPLLRSLPRTTLPRLLRHTHTTSEKQHAAAHAIADHLALLTPGAFIGIGSGSTIPHLVTALKTTSSIFVPTSHQSRQLLLDARLPICAIDALPPHTRLRIAFDGADEVDSSRNCIKGGGACLMLEKLVAVQAERFIVIAGE